MYVAVSPVVQQYFNKKRTLASGLTIAGFSMGSFIFPPATRFSVDYFGWRGTLVVYACVAMQNVWLCALHRPFVKPSKPSQEAAKRSKCILYLKRLFPLGLLHKPTYLLFCLTSFTVNVNFSVYTFHIVNKCLSDGIDKYRAAFVPSIGGIIDAIMGPLFGMLASTPFFRTKKIILYSCTATGLGGFLMLVGLLHVFAAIIVIVALLSLCVGKQTSLFF